MQRLLARVRLNLWVYREEIPHWSAGVFFVYLGIGLFGTVWALHRDWSNGEELAWRFAAMWGFVILPLGVAATALTACVVLLLMGVAFTLFESFDRWFTALLPKWLLPRGIRQRIEREEREKSQREEETREMEEICLEKLRRYVEKQKEHHARGTVNAVLENLGETDPREAEIERKEETAEAEENARQSVLVREHRQTATHRLKPGARRSSLKWAK